MSKKFLLEPPGFSSYLKIRKEVIFHTALLAAAVYEN
jgi:hypothetical protein